MGNIRSPLRNVCSPLRNISSPLRNINRTRFLIKFKPSLLGNYNAYANKLT